MQDDGRCVLFVCNHRGNDGVDGVQERGGTDREEDFPRRENISAFEFDGGCGEGLCEQAESELVHQKTLEHTLGLDLADNLCRDENRRMGHYAW